jgi:CrcB protein
VILALVVGAMAGVGAVTRYVVDQVVSHWYRSPLPWGTFAVNVTGSFALGLVTGFAMHHGLSRDLDLVLGTGLAGGYTTWSTLMVETATLADDSRNIHAAVTAGGSLAAGLAAAAAGLGIALL